MNDFRSRLRQFFAGRYGTDQLGRFMMYATLVLIIISFFVRSGLLSVVIMVLLIIGIVRMLSRNYAKRAAENQKYLEIRNRIFGFFRNGFRAAKDKDHAYFRCPQCGQRVRVPKGKGQIMIHCPKCRTSFSKRT